MLLGLIRYLRGYVKFEVTGKFPERFMNLCARCGVTVWKPLPSNEAITACMYAYEYKRIRALARRSHTKTKVVCKRGLPFAVRRLRRKSGLFAGALAGALLCMFLSCFVWSVKVSGAESISEAYLASLLEQHGVSAGTWFGSLDLDQIERDVIKQCPEIRWISLNTAGGIITAEVREAYLKTEPESSSQPCNVKAAKDGVVTKVEVLMGTSEVKTGSGVAKGDLLVSGLSETSQGNLNFVRARANIYADVAESRSFDIAKEQSYNSLAENYINRSRLKILWFEFPCSVSFGSFQSSVSSLGSTSLCLNDVVMPVAVKTETEREITKLTAALTEAQARGRAEADCLLYEIFERGESVLKLRNISVTENKDSYICSVSYVFNENIAEQVNFEVTD